MHDVTAAPGQRTAASVRPAIWLTLGFMVLQAAWILTIPPFRGIDEFDHAYRAAAVAGGQWVATEPAEDGRGLLVDVPASLVKAANAQCSVLDYTGPDNCTAVRPTSEGRVLVASGAATYFPAYYAFVGKVGELADGSESLYVMRAATALLCALLFFGAAWSSTRGSSVWPRLALLLASTPVLIYSTGIVAPNGVEMTAALALWCSLIALGDRALGEARENERRLMLIAILSAVTLCLLRLLGPLFVVAIVGTALAWRGEHLWRVARRHIGLAVSGATAAAVAALVFAWWLRGPANVISTGGDQSGESEGVGLIYLLLWPLQSVAAFPYRNQPGPLIVYGVIGALVIGLVCLAVRYGTRRARAIIVGSLLAAITLPFVATLLTVDDRGVIWQGRYGLPVGIGFVLLSGAGLAEVPRLGVPAQFLHGALVAYVVAVVACLWKVRSAELNSNPASIDDVSWLVPPAALLAVLVVAAAAAFARAMREPKSADA